MAERLPHYWQYIFWQQLIFIDMENLKIEKTEITWENTKTKFGSEIKYKNQILNQGDHISISKIMYVNGEYKLEQLTHIPIELIDKIKSLDSV
jgi:hypothetical protein